MFILFLLLSRESLDIHNLTPSTSPSPTMQTPKKSNLSAHRFHTRIFLSEILFQSFSFIYRYIKKMYIITENIAFDLS